MDFAVEFLLIVWLASRRKCPRYTHCRGSQQLPASVAVVASLLIVCLGLYLSVLLFTTGPT